MTNRTGKQIRDRYLNYLDTNVKKEKFSLEEDKNLRELYLKYGSKWTKISKYIDGRTPEMIKNRFYSFWKSKIHVYERRKFNIKRLRLLTSSRSKVKDINKIENSIQNAINILYINNELKDADIYDLT